MNNIGAVKTVDDNLLATIEKATVKTAVISNPRIIFYPLFCGETIGVPISCQQTQLLMLIQSSQLS